MKNHITTTVIFLTVSVIFLTSGCTTNPPNAPQVPINSYGKIIVTSNIEGAEIYVDDVFTGRYTPDTIEVLTGLRTVKLIMMGSVLLEDFANVSCIPCVTTNKITHSLAQSYGSKLNIVKFPTNFPKPTDPFYLAAKPDCDTRMAFYSIITAPTIIIDGVTRPVPSDSNDIKQKIDNALLESLPYIPDSSEINVLKDEIIEIAIELENNNSRVFNISVTDSISGGIIYTKATVTPINTSGFNLIDYTLHTVIIEKRIEEPVPPGSNGETVFYDVLRKMLPSSAGSTLLGSNLTQSVDYENQTQISGAWNSNELLTIVYLQNKNTKKVLQAASAE